MGILAYVYRRAGEPYDCTRGGISSRFRYVCVVNAQGPFGPADDIPAVIMLNHYQKALSLVPAVKDSMGQWAPAPGWHMMGGNYAATSDSRFHELAERLSGQPFYGAVAIHDRLED